MSSRRRASIGVSKMPGAIVFTRIRQLARSRAATRVVPRPGKGRNRAAKIRLGPFGNMDLEIENALSMIGDSGYRCS
jgi:hypothetical protein